MRLLILIFSCTELPQGNASEIDAIKQVLTIQQTYWNNGDIDGFMLGYFNSEKFEFSWVNGTEYDKYGNIQGKWANGVLQK